MTTPDNSVTTWLYAGNQTTVTDPKSHAKTLVYDALGRLTYATDGVSLKSRYFYDPLDNLVGVKQGTASAFDSNGNCTACQTRIFDYDSLKRLYHTKNPESGDIYYTYDANGNLLSRTDARQIATTYTYDALNRVITKNYPNMAVTYTYDDSAITTPSTV